MEQIHVRANPAEKKELTEKASRLGLSLSAYLKFVGLNAEIQIKLKAKNGN